MTGQAVLFAAGACVEFAGIVLLGFPDFVPGALRLSRWLRVRARSVTNRVRRLLGLPPGQTFVSIEAADEISVADRASLMKSVRPDATIEERVAFLLTRDQEAQRDVNALTARVDAIETEEPRRLEGLRTETEAHVADALAEARDAYRPLRIAGTIALAIGLACMSVATFL
jgi:hypothetical protein